MKNFKNKVYESVKSEDKNIINFLESIAKLSSGVQHELYMQKVNDADSVDVVSIEDVFTDEEIEGIKTYIHPQPKECYKNSWELCDIFYDNHIINYCEGFINLKGFPIEHAFNSVDGKYVDITTEMALKRKIEDSYVLLGEWNSETVRKVLLQNGFYGDIYNTLFLNKYKEK